MKSRLVYCRNKLCSPKLHLFLDPRRDWKVCHFKGIRIFNHFYLPPCSGLWWGAWKNCSKNLPTPFISLIPLSILSSGGDGGLLHFPRLIISFLLVRGRRYFRVIYFLYSRKNCTTAIIFASPDHLIAIILRRPHHLIIFILDYLMIIWLLLSFLCFS